MNRAFVLGAGLGTRLRPLTLQLPKPLIPVHQRPLIGHAFAHLKAAGVREFVVNTHHLPAAYAVEFPDGAWEGCPVTFRHEPVLLETGGGLANVRDLLDGGGPFFVYNGDILATLPLAPAIGRHCQDGNLVTLILRSRGPVCNVAMESSSGRVVDLRNARGTSHPELYQFTGICLTDPGLFRYLSGADVIESVVPAWLRAMDAGERIGGVVIDDGWWLDLGDRESYLEAHRLPSEAVRIHPSAEIAPDAVIDAESSVGAGCRIGAGAVIRQSVLWPGARVDAGATLDRCIVLSGHTASGVLTGADV